MRAAWFLVAVALAGGTWLVLPGPRRRPRTRAAALARRLAEAGTSLSPVQFRCLAVASSAATALAVQAVSATPALAAVGAVAGAAAPYRWLGGRRHRRRRQLRAAWPEAVDLLTGAVRAGDSLPQAAARLGERGPEPLRGPFASVDDVYRATGDFAVAMGRLTSLVADPVADRVAAALCLAKDIGGSHVVVVLTRLGDTLRAELTVRREIEARRSWVVTSARAAALAPWVVLGLFAMRPSTLAAYRSTTGAAVVVLGGLLTICGYRLMLNMGRIPDEERFA